MFAVKGWSLDPASLKPQTEPFKPPKSEGSESKKSKKRKRGHPNATKESLNAGSDVAQSHEQNVEVRGSPVKQEKEAHKKQKLEQVSRGEWMQKQPSNSTNQQGGGNHVRRSEIPRSKDMSEDEVRVKKAKQGKRGREKPKREEKNVKTAEVDSLDKTNQPEQSTTQDVPPLPPSAKLTPMQSAMRQKLISARFRHLNQTLYTEPSIKAQELFAQNPEMFEDYHAGFRQQVSIWPENPLDNILSEIRRRGNVKLPKHDKRSKPQPDALYGGLPRTHGICITADLGCGDARLAQTLKTSGDTTKLNLKLHSYDLHSPSSLVTKADISALPLADGTVDVAIFCLALMGTNWISFVEEAYRILHWKGELWVAEIKSRLGRVGRSGSKGKPVDHSVGSKRKVAALKAAKEAKKREEAEKEVNEEEVLQTVVDGVPNSKEETDVAAFVDVLKRRGFLLKAPADLRNKMFVKMEFVKALTPVKGKGVPKEGDGGAVKGKKKFIPELDDEVMTEDEATALKPCLYKIR